MVFDRVKVVEWLHRASFQKVGILAFDTVDHKILLSKLYNYGFRGPIYNVLQSYSKDRTQFVSIDGNNSDILNIETGVPLGSVSGPVLINLYRNDLPSVIKNNSVHYVFASNSNIHDLCFSLNKNLNLIEKWLRSNFLTWNLLKTCCMFVSMKNFPSDALIRINDAKIALVDNIDCLGVFIDEKLTFRNHIFNISNKLSKNTGLKLNYLPQ